MRRKEKEGKGKKEEEWKGSDGKEEDKGVKERGEKGDELVEANEKWLLLRQ